MLEALAPRDIFNQLKRYLSRIRKLFIFVALGLMIVIVAVEIGAPVLIPALQAPGSATADMGTLLSSAGDELPQEVRQLLATQQNVTAQLAGPAVKPPGWAIRSMALVDAVTLLTICIVVASHFVRASLIGKTQGIVTLVFSSLLLIGAIVFIVLVLVQLFAMIALLLSIPFGTLIYLLLFGFFDRGSAAVLVTWLFSLKVAFGLCIVAANERYLQNVGFVLAVLSTLVASIIVAFLHGIVPGFLVSITDAAAAIVVCVIAAIWSVLLLVGSILSISNLVRSSASRLA